MKHSSFLLMLVFWFAMQRGLIGRYQHFRGTYCLHFHGRYSVYILFNYSLLI
jgi:hypothetical protein